MTDIDLKLQTVKTIPLVGLLALLDSLISVSRGMVKQDDLDLSHKAVVTIAALIKAIKEAETHNKSLCPAIDSAAPDPITRAALSPEELRTRLTRYLTRLDDDAAAQHHGNVYDSSKKH